MPKNTEQLLMILAPAVIILATLLVRATARKSSMVREER